MTLVYVILPVSLLIAAGFVVAFAIATRRGQFDDLKTPGMRMLFDEDADQRSTAQGVRRATENPL